MNTHTTEGAASSLNGPATTTEELIVQYLDGELMRKELETMLFERLAQSPEARGLLREYLTMRGAIRASLDDTQFQLSSDLDVRTRLRIEHMLETIAVEGPAVAPARYSPDAKPLATEPVTRRINRWALRPSVAALALLLAVGGTWLLTRETTPRVALHSTASAPMASVRPSTESSEVTIPGTAAVTKNLETTNAAPRITRVASKHRSAASTGEMAQNSQQTPAVQPAPSVQQPVQQEDPADVMLSRRTAKYLNATSTEKREVVVTSHDRL